LRLVFGPSESASLKGFKPWRLEPRYRGFQLRSYEIFENLSNRLPLLLQIV
jgi:hypothetical protein